jgi:hypothetical protein
MKQWQPMLLLFAALALPALAYADDDDKKKGHKSDEIDTEHIFGFSEGADIGEKGEKEIENTFTARYKKRAGVYFAGENELAFLYSPADTWRVSASGFLDNHHVLGVPDLPDRSGPNFSGLSGEIRARLVERKNGPFALSLSLAPSWSRVDDISGAVVNRYGLTTTLLADAELISKKLYGTINIALATSSGKSEKFDPELGTSATWSPESALEFSGAVAGVVRKGVLLGAELRYLTTFQGAFLNRLEGQALYVGPTLYVQLAEHWATKLTWQAQVAGRASEDPGRLDLVNFERYQARWLVVHNF